MTIWDVISKMSDEEVKGIFDPSTTERETYYRFKIAGETFRFVVYESTVGRISAIQYMQIDGDWETFKTVGKESDPRTMAIMSRMEKIIHSNRAP